MIYSRGHFAAQPNCKAHSLRPIQKSDSKLVERRATARRKRKKKARHSAFGPSTGSDNRGPNHCAPATWRPFSSSSGRASLPPFLAPNAPEFRPQVGPQVGAHKPSWACLRVHDLRATGLLRSRHSAATWCTCRGSLRRILRRLVVCVP